MMAGALVDRSERMVIMGINPGTGMFEVREGSRRLTVELLGVEGPPAFPHELGDQSAAPARVGIRQTLGNERVTTYFGSEVVESADGLVHVRVTVADDRLLRVYRVRWLGETAWRGFGAERIAVLSDGAVGHYLRYWRAQARIAGSTEERQFTRPTTSPIAGNPPATGSPTDAASWEEAADLLDPNRSGDYFSPTDLWAGPAPSGTPEDPVRTNPLPHVRARETRQAAENIPEPSRGGHATTPGVPDAWGPSPMAGVLAAWSAVRDVVIPADTSSNAAATYRREQFVDDAAFLAAFRAAILDDFPPARNGDAVTPPRPAPPKALRVDAKAAHAHLEMGATGAATWVFRDLDERDEAIRIGIAELDRRRAAAASPKTTRRARTVASDRVAAPVTAS